MENTTAKESNENSKESPVSPEAEPKPKEKLVAVTVDPLTKAVHVKTEPEPTYGDLKKKIEEMEATEVRLMAAVEEAGSATAKQAERADRAEERIRTLRHKASKDKEKILDRLRKLEGESSFPITFWERFQASHLPEYIDRNLKPTAKIPSGISRDGDWLSVLLHAYKEHAKGKRKSATEAIFERHADLEETPPKNCVCPACALRKFIAEQREILVNQEKEIKRLTRELEDERGKKTKFKKVKGKGGRR